MGLSLEIAKKELELTRPSFEQMSLNKVDFSKEMQYAVQAFQTNTALLNCEEQSIKNCLVNVALSGLSLSPVMKLAYLVPRGGKCCLDPSYMGLIKIITDTGSVQSIFARLVYMNEPFEIELGTNCYIKHGIVKNGIKGVCIGAYSIAVLNDGSNHIEWMDEAQLQAIKKRSKSGNVWATDEEEMKRKTVVKRHFKYLPKSERAHLAAQAIAFDDEVNGIDFHKEQSDAKNAESPQGATPEAPMQEAMATDDDYKEIIDLVTDEVFKNVKSFNASPTLSPTQMHRGVYSKIPVNGGVGIEKSKAEEYIAFLKKEKEFFTANPVTPPQEEGATNA